MAGKMMSGALPEGSENLMGLFDKLKKTAGGAKDKVDDIVEKNSDKIPDKVEKVYDKVSDAAEKVIPGEDAAGDTPAN
jgi:hypothetical protein